MNLKKAKNKGKGGSNNNNYYNATGKQVKSDANKLRSVITELQKSNSSSPDEVACTVLAVLDLQEWLAV